MASRDPASDDASSGAQATQAQGAPADEPSQPREQEGSSRTQQLLADWQDWVESQTRPREADISWGSADDWWGAGGDPWSQARSGQQGQSGGGWYGWDSYMSTTATTQPQHYHSNSCNRTASGFGKVCNWDELSDAWRSSGAWRSWDEGLAGTGHGTQILQVGQGGCCDA